MAKFRKKPVVVEAAQFVLGEDERAVPGVCRCYGGWPHVHTIHSNQPIALESGDWILPEPDGEHYYPVKPDIFVATYEPVE